MTIEEAVEAMERGTPERAKKVTVFGVPLADLSAEQCRVAMFWLAGELERVVDEDRGYLKRLESIRKGARRTDHRFGLPV